MSIKDTDVVARLRAGADTVEMRGFDAQEVLAGSRRALRRRRSWQAVGAGTTAAAVVVSLALAGPVPVRGLGDVTLPGAEQLRELFGLADADPPGCEVPEPAVRRTPDAAPATSLRPGVTFNLTDARPMSGCYDVRIDGDFEHPGIDASTVTEDGTFWSAPTTDGIAGRPDGSGLYHLRRVDPFGDGEEDRLGVPAGVLQDDEVLVIKSLTPQGGQAAWFEVTADGPDRPANRVVLSTGGQRTDPVTGEYAKARSVAEIRKGYGNTLAVTDQRVAWREEDATTIANPGSMVAKVAFIESGEPEFLADHATAIGADDDEIVVATVDQPTSGAWTTTFTSYGDDGSETTVLTLEHPRDMLVPVVDITDDVLTYALDFGDLVVVPRVDGIVEPNQDRSVAVQVGGYSVNSLSAAGDAVAWWSGPAVYMLRDAAPGQADGPDLVQIDQGGPMDRMTISLAGDRIAWSATDESDATITTGRLREPLEIDTTTRAVPDEPGGAGRAVPAAPVVTVPDDAVFPTLD